MKPLLHTSIEFAIELCKTQSMPAFEAFLASISEVLEGDDLAEFFDRTVDILSNRHPQVYEWFIEEIPSYLQYLEILQEEAIQRMEADFRDDDNNGSDDDDDDDEEEIIYYITKQDLKHILLDEGVMEGSHFYELEDELAISIKAKEVLEEYFDLELIESLIKVF